MAVICRKEKANPAKKRRIERMDSRSEERNCPDLISLLPDDCLSHIFSFLSAPRDRCSSSAVSKRWLLLQVRLVPCFSGHHENKAVVPPRRFLCRKASDLRLAAMAIGSTRSGSPSEIHIHAFSLRSSFFVGVSDMGLSFVAASCKQLETLSISNCRLVSDRGLKFVAQFCPRLKKLNLSNLPKISNNGVSAIAQSCKKLSEVRVEACPLVGDGALKAFFEYSMELKVMSVKDCPLVGASDLLSVSGSLSKLALTGSFLTDQALIDLSQKTPKLESLVLEKCHRVTSHGLLGALRNFSSSLRSISLIKCNEVGRAPRKEQESSWKLNHLLRSVTINGCPMVCDEFLYSLGKRLLGTKSLNFVDLTGISDVGFIFLLGAMQRRDALRSIDLSGCKRITDWSLAAMATAAGDSLQTLALERCGVTDNGLRLIGLHCKGLVELHLSQCGNIGDDGIAKLLLEATSLSLPLKDRRMQKYHR